MISWNGLAHLLIQIICFAGMLTAAFFRASAGTPVWMAWGLLGGCLLPVVFFSAILIIELRDWRKKCGAVMEVEE